MTRCRYPQPEAHPCLEPGIVHIWCASLDSPVTQLAAWAETLSAVEADRASQFRFDRHRRRYIATHGILRELLGHYLEEEPASVDISYSEYGKPFLTQSKLNFNLSHSEDAALYAFCWDAPVGIDLEKIRPLTDAGTLAARFFSRTEYARFLSLSATDREDAFFACWTHKEAFIKAVGEGLSFPLDAFDVSFEPGRSPELERIRGSEEAARQWSLYALTPIAGFAAALVLRGHGWQLSHYHYLPARESQA